MVVEDNPDVRAVVAEQLATLGLDVIEVSDAHEAMELLRSDTKFDLLFTDVVMPGMTGLELARETRKLRAQLPILLTSGFAETSATDPTLRSVLRMPYRINELAAAIRRRLRSPSVAFDQNRDEV